MSIEATFGRFEAKLLRVHRAVDGVCSCKEGKKCPTPGKHPARFDDQKVNLGVHNARQKYKDNDFVNYNVGVATGAGLLIVDVDPRNAGHLTWTEICRGNEVPETWTVATGGGGYHYYFRVPPEVELRNLSFEGVDFQWDGKYCVAPPSIHPSGVDYVWEDCDPEEEPPAVIPDWLVKWMQSKTKMLDSTMVPQGHTEPVVPAAHEWDWIDEILSKLSPDIGYEHWLGVGMGLHATGEEHAFRTWDTWSQKGKKYRDGECARKWKSFSVTRTASASHTYKWIFAMADMYRIPYAENLDDFVKDWQTPQKKTDAKSQIENAGVILKALSENLLQHSRIEHHEFALACALQILASCVQGSVSGPTGTSLNLYQWLAAPPSAGKDGYKTRMCEILENVREGILMPRYNSVAGFRNCLLAYNSRCAVRDEFHDEYLNVTTSRNEFVREIGTDYKILYNTPTSLEPVVIKASMTPRIEFPFFSLLGFSTTGGLEKASQGEFLSSGMGSRFLFSFADHHHKEKDPQKTPLCQSVLSSLKSLAEAGLTMAGKGQKDSIETLASIQRSMVEKSASRVQHTPQISPTKELTIAERVQELRKYDIEKTREAMLEVEDEAFQSVWGRKSQHVLRLASLRCLSDERNEILESDYTWAKEFVDRSTTAALQFMGASVGTTKVDYESGQRVERIVRTLRVLVAKTGGPVTKREILKSCRMEPRALEMLLNHAVFVGLIKCFDKRGTQVYPEKIERGQRLSV